VLFLFTLTGERLQKNRGGLINQDRPEEKNG